MHMAKLICVNWGNLPPAEYPLGLVTLLSGGSGTGKTTLADAIQTVMTAAKRGLFTYNPGQEETTQHGRHGKLPRTLPSYILGCDDNLYARPQGAYGYVAIVFAPSSGEDGGKVFTALVGVRAYLETIELAGGRRRRTSKDEGIQLLVVEGHAVGITDLVLGETGSGTAVVPTESALRHLRERYGDRVVSDFGDRKSAYLSKLYGLLRSRPSVSSTEAEKAARTFSRFMAYKPIESIDEFVRTQILEPRDMSSEIDNIADGMRKIRDLRSDSERLQRNVDALAVAERDGEALRTAWRDQVESQARRWHMTAHDARVEAERCASEIRTLNQEQAGIRRRIEEIDRRATEIDTQRADLRAVQRQHQSVVERDGLKDQIAREQQSAASALQDLLIALDSARKSLAAAKQLTRLPARTHQEERLTDAVVAAVSASQELSAFDINTIGALASEIAHSGLEPSVDRLQALAEAVAGFDDALGLFGYAVTDPDGGLRTIAEQLTGAVQSRLDELRRNEDEIRRRVDELNRGGRVQYPPAVARAVQALRQSLPKSDPVVLCDLVDIRNAEWQAAVEGYLDNNRFVLIVPPEYEARATRLVKSLGRPSAHVVQGERAGRDAARREIPGDSIVNILDVKHPIARAYLVAAYGSVVQVNDTEALRHTPRGLTQDGQGSSSYKMYNCLMGDDSLVFGRSGRERQLRALHGRLEEMRIERESVETKLADLQQIRQQCQAVGSSTVERPVRVLLTAARTIQGYRERLGQLDLSAVADLDAKLNGIESELSAIKKEKEHRLERSGAIGAHRDQLNAVMIASEREAERAEVEANMAAEGVRRLAEVDTEYDAVAVLDRLREEAVNQPLTSEQAAKAIEDALHRVVTAKGKFLTRVRDYNSQARSDEQVAYQSQLEDSPVRDWADYYAFMEALTQVKAQLRRQRENRLASVTDELRRAEQTVRNIFTTNFCDVVHAAVQFSEKYIRALNDDLKRHRFSEEVYLFTSEWVPEYKRYFDFFEAVMRTEGLGEGVDLFGDVKLTEGEQAVREELHQLLLGNDEERAHNKLLDIADYRNYHRYDILRDTGHGVPTPLSEYGSGSGGQLETPSYVIRAAAVASAYRLDEGNCHLRSVLIDESFAKMDETRAKEVIAMLSQTMGFQVVMVIPSKSSGSFMPIITNKIVFSKVRSDAAPGELKTVTYVDQQTVNRDAVDRLYALQRQRIREEVSRSHAAKVASEHGLA